MKLFEMNGFFKNAVSNFRLSKNSFVINDEHKNIQDPVEKIFCKISVSPQYFNYHKYDKDTNTFRSEQVILSEIKNEIKDLYPNRTTTHNNISLEILQQNAKL